MEVVDFFNTEIMPHLVRFGITSVGAVAVAYAAFRHFAQKWLDSKFAERLEAIRHDYALQVAQAKVRFDSLLTARIRDQENDFKLLPEAWTLVEDAFGRLSWVISPIQSYTQVAQMQGDVLEEYLKDCDFKESEKQKIRQSSGSTRTEIFREIENVTRLDTVYLASKNLLTFVSKNGIFLPVGLKEDLKNISSEIHQLANRQALIHETGGEKPSELWDHLYHKVRPIYERIEGSIEQRLRSYSNPPEGPAELGVKTVE